MELFTGLGVAMITPFDQYGAIDLPSLRALVHHLHRGKTDYLVVMGTTGESAVLNEDEKQLIIETIIETNDARLPIVLGIGGNNTAKLVKEMEYASTNYRIDGFLSVSPYYNKPSQEGIYQHFKALSEAAAHPIMLYNVPGRTASHIETATVVRLANNCSNIMAIKESSGKLSQTMDLKHHCPQDFQIICGDDSLALPAISLGANGLVSVLGNALPSQMSNLVHAALKGDIAQARAIHYHTLELMNLCFEEGNPAGVKAMTNILGIGNRFTRLPLVEASEELLAKIKKELALILT